jgi:hypothetical protein
MRASASTGLSLGTEQIAYVLGCAIVAAASTVLSISSIMPLDVVHMSLAMEPSDWTA